MPEQILLGDEAAALGAIHAGISNAYGYPGTPSTEIMEYLIEYARQQDAENPVKLTASWCSNEKTAFEEALGASLVNKRSIVTMKHVGLNVAADPFINAALLDIRGGLVLAVADDPGMHSSQNEQDSRFYADFAGIPCFEPVDQQQAYDMTRMAFDLSEEYHLPVMIRLVTRLAHSRSNVSEVPSRDQNPLSKSTNRRGWMLLPSTARVNWDELIAKQKILREYSEKSGYNTLSMPHAKTQTGVVTTGLGLNYFLENLEDMEIKPNHLHISVYPVPAGKLRTLARSVERLLFIEEGYPFVEKYTRGTLEPAVTVAGKMSGEIPASGELNPDNIRCALGLAPRRTDAVPDAELPKRPPQLCSGCPHRDTYLALNAVLKGYSESLVTSDIGCYALGALPPYSSIETIVCMGASVGMAKGASEAGFHPVVAVIGDSTFLHSGMTPLLDAVADKTDMTVVIVDNETVAMTGGQETIIPSSALENVIRGLGVDPVHIRTIQPLPKNHEENCRVLRGEIDYKGLSVVLAVRECIETAVRKKRRQ